MKILGFIYGVILRTLENKISADEALDMIRTILTEIDKEVKE